MFEKGVLISQSEFLFHPAIGYGPYLYR